MSEIELKQKDKVKRDLVIKRSNPTEKGAQPEYSAMIHNRATGANEFASEKIIGVAGLRKLLRTFNIDDDTERATFKTLQDRHQTRLNDTFVDSEDLVGLGLRSS